MDIPKRGTTLPSQAMQKQVMRLDITCCIWERYRSGNGKFRSAAGKRVESGEQTENRQTPVKHGDLSERLYLTMTAINIPQNYG